MSRREHDAVREARDALLVIAVVTPPLLWSRSCSA